MGHDWGSATAWAFAGIYPERTIQLVAISVGHPAGYQKGEHRGEQKQKSWCALNCMFITMCRLCDHGKHFPLSYTLSVSSLVPEKFCWLQFLQKKQMNLTINSQPYCQLLHACCMLACLVHSHQHVCMCAGICCCCVHQGQESKPCCLAPCLMVYKQRRPRKWRSPCLGSWGWHSPCRSLELSQQLSTGTGMRHISTWITLAKIMITAGDR